MNKRPIATLTRILVGSFFLISILANSFITHAADGTRHVPTIDDLLTLKSIGGAQISPDGHRVAYTVTNADFKQDAFVTQIWLAETGQSLGQSLKDILDMTGDPPSLELAPEVKDGGEGSGNE